MEHTVLRQNYGVRVKCQSRDVLNQAPSDTIDAVSADFRAPFDELGRKDEDDFNGYKTLRIAGILGIAVAA